MFHGSRWEFPLVWLEIMTLWELTKRSRDSTLVNFHFSGLVLFWAFEIPSLSMTFSMTFQSFPWSKFDHFHRNCSKNYFDFRLCLFCKKKLPSSFILYNQHHFHDFPWPTTKFHDFPGLENEILLKIPDFPGLHDLYDLWNSLWPRLYP